MQGRRVGLVIVAVLVVLAGGVLAFVLSRGGGAAAAALPDTRDYHSLLVDPGDARHLLLGTHDGLYVSRDGGRHWSRGALAGRDAMGLVRQNGKTIWVAGHGVLERSVDGGSSWTGVRPAGLPSLDLHAFAADPRDPKRLVAAVAGVGLYRSVDGGRSFTLLSREVGAAVMALAVLADGRLLAGDMRRGLLSSRDQGASWRQVLAAQVMGLAGDPRDPKRVLATGGGIALSTDGGRSWRSGLDLAKGAGPVAWSASAPEVAYVAGLDRILYRSGDRGASWVAVSAKGG